MGRSSQARLSVVDEGTGRPLVLIPGIQGRWEYQRGTVTALARRFRVITFSFDDRLPAPETMPASASPFDPYAEHLARVLTDRGVTRALLCGISFGGLVALRFAATQPDHTAALILVSTPGPGWHLNKRHVVYARWPRLLAPAFFAEAPRRLRREIKAAIPNRGDRLRFLFEQARTVASAPLSTLGMAARARLMAHVEPAPDCARICVPTLIITGEPDLDYVVPAQGTAGYATLIKGATTVVLERTGHLGSVTKPDLFAAAISRFVDSTVPPVMTELEAGDSHAR